MNRNMYTEEEVIALMELASNTAIESWKKGFIQGFLQTSIPLSIIMLGYPYLCKRLKAKRTDAQDNQ